MKRLDHWNSMDIADHARRQPDDPGPTGMDGESMFGTGEERAKRVDPQARDYLARKAEQQERRDMWLIIALIVGPMIAVLAVAAYADPVGRLAHDTARGEYCGAC